MKTLFNRLELLIETISNIFLGLSSNGIHKCMRNYIPYFSNNYAYINLIYNFIKILVQFIIKDPLDLVYYII